MPLDKISWLRKNKEFLSIRGIEKHLGMPDSTLIKVIKGTRELPEKWKQPLEDFIKVLQKP